MRPVETSRQKRLLLIIISVISLACIPIEQGVDIQSLSPQLQRRICKPPVIDLNKVERIVTPTRRLSADEYPEFNDDMEFRNMQLAIDRQIERFEKIDLTKKIQFGDDVYKQQALLDSILEFQKISSQTRACFFGSNNKAQKDLCIRTLNDQVRNKFLVYAPKLTSSDPRHGEPKDTFFTAYYSPTLRGSRTRGPIYKYPLYVRPLKESLAQSPRRQIDFKGRLSGKNLEIYYVDDLFDIYLMQVQGSGIVSFAESGDRAYVNYGGTNKQKWNFISIYMEEKGYIEDRSIYAQREFLEVNPQRHEEIYSTCPSYVYFRPSIQPPTGSGGAPVTSGRSIATDTLYYPRKGTLSFIMAQRPKPGQIGQDPRESPIEFQPFSRFVLDQDTGGAIDGKARVDIYQGDDDYARLAAFNTQHTGNLFFLVLKPN